MDSNKQRARLRRTKAIDALSSAAPFDKKWVQDFVLTAVAKEVSEAFKDNNRLKEQLAITEGAVEACIEVICKVHSSIQNAGASTTTMSTTDILSEMSSLVGIDGDTANIINNYTASIHRHKTGEELPEEEDEEGMDQAQQALYDAVASSRRRSSTTIELHNAVASRVSRMNNHPDEVFMDDLMMSNAIESEDND